MIDKEPHTQSQKRNWLELDVNPYVFYISAGLIVSFVVLAISFHQAIGNWFETLQSNIANYGGWFFIWTMNIALVFAITLLLGRFGDVRLGGDDAEPEFSTTAWFAMLFSAGMGIGLLFYGVAEPMFHFVASPFAEPGTPEAARLAMDLSFLHWGFHPWALYTIVGLSLAFFSFNKGYPLTIRSVLAPLLGDKVNGPWGYTVDIMATVATLFGVATSLGLGVRQVNAGLHHLFGLPQTPVVQIVLIACITAIATVSVVKGLDAGIKRLSELNIMVAAALMFFVLAVGPTLFIMNALIENIGFYLQNLPQLSTWSETYENTSWQNGWTVFYWGWWIAWSPFVGMFIARVSKGRTIRQFVLGVMLVPSFVTFLWITVFGNSALNIEMFGSGQIAQAVQENIPVSLFVLLEKFPLSGFTCLLAVIVVITFFVTSSDSGSMVIDIITADGNPDPPVFQRLFWAISEGVVAGALLLGGGLVALQTAAITTGLPFAVVILLMCWSLYKGLDEYVGPQRFRVEKRPKIKVKLKTKPSPKTIARLNKKKMR
ncbi:BCCT family transporter [Desulfobaculum sp. SPO524]|uniref:BCCT family transporter n=1 Tax=Desulfobaculum sp. SPO524 TaxID=3378071 RepID=UPI003851E924